MDGVHDLGGLEGLGSVNPTPSEPVFFSEWERTTFTMLIPAMLGGINLDEFRHGIEKMHPAEYLSSRYYEHWLHTIEHGLGEKGVIDADELEARTQRYREDPDAPLPDREDAEQVEMLLGVLRTGASTKMPTDAPPAFTAGDPVRVRTYHPTGHTRAARYVRGKQGVVDHVYDSFVFPDSNAHGRGEHAHYVYRVRFTAEEVWGEATSEPNQVIYLDLWEPYLEPAPSGNGG